MKLRWKIAVGLVISAIFLVYALMHVNYREMIKAFSEASYIWTIPMMVSVLFTMVIRAKRWRWLLLPVRSLRFEPLFSSVMIGFMANNLLPARIGEIVRAVSLSRKQQLSRSSVFATVVAERVFDSLGLLSVFFLTLFAVDYPPELRRAGYGALALTAIVLAFLILLKVKTDLAISAASVPLRIVSGELGDRVRSILRKFADGLSILTSPASIAVIYLYSVGLWIFTAVSSYLIFIAFDLTPSVWATFILLFVTVLGVALPSSPGYIGTFHAACMIGFDLIHSLGMFGNEVSKSVALSYSVVLWSTQFFPVTLIGLYYLRKEHLSFSEIEKAQ